MPAMSPASAVTIRQATTDDATELARLRWDFSAELDHADHDLATFAPRFARALRDCLDSGRWTIWVAELDDRLVGTAWVERVDKVPRPYERPEQWGYVTNVYVAPGHRNAGIGGRLLEAVIREARRSGWELLLLWPSEASGRFYARLGFRRSADALELDLRASNAAAT